ncbi:MAG: RND transporter [Candidatus Binatia bacterium]|nr:MAG: RND transporter [Candidatus Binatia bacterium]
MRAGFLVVFSLAVVVSGPATAGEKVRLTLGEAIRRAENVSPDLRSSSAEVLGARAGLRRHKAFLPSNPFVSVGLQPRLSDDIGASYGVAVSQEIELARQSGLRLRVARAELGQFEAHRESVRLTAIAQVKSAFISALGARERVELARTEAEQARRLAEEAASARGASTVSRMEANIAAAQAARAERDLALAEKAWGDALGLLRYYLAYPADQELELVGELELPRGEPPPLSTLIGHALENRPDWVAQQRAFDAADERVRLRRRERIPNVTVTASVSRFEGDTFGGADVGFYLPVLHRGDVEVEEALQARERARADLDDTRRIVEWEVGQAYRRYVAAVEAFEILRREVLPRSDENLRLEEELYARGEVGLVDLIGIRIDALSARREYVDALVEYNDARVELERSVGGSLPAEKRESKRS